MTMSSHEFETQGIVVQTESGEYSFRFDGLWQRPPSETSEWERWWSDFVLSADLAWTEGTVVQRPVDLLLQAVTPQDPPPEIVLVQLLAVSGNVAAGTGAVAPSAAEAGPSPFYGIEGPFQLAAPVMAVVRGGPLKVSQGFEALLIGAPLELASPSGPMIETMSAISNDGVPAAIAWHYRLASDDPDGLSVSFLSNAFEFIDDVVVDVARSATSLVFFPRQEPIAHGA